MVNGHGPPRLLTDSDYQKIKSGFVVTSGTYEGCIQVGESDYYWIEPDDTDWTLNEGVPDTETQVLITATIWDQCKAGGTMTWDSRGEVWEYRGESYRWAGYSGQDVELHEM